MARKQKRRGDTANAVTTSDADGREMYALFLEGDYPNALRAAELILSRKSDDPLALAVLAEVKAALADRTEAVEDPSSIVLGDDDLVEDTFVTPAPTPSPPRFDEITSVDALPPEAQRALEELRPTVRPPTHDDDVLALSWGSAVDTLRVHDQAFDRKNLYETYLASDFRSALELADELLTRRPDDAMAQAIRSECLAALELRSSIPVAAVDTDEIAAARLDERSAALLARVDGATTVEALAATADIPEADAIRLLETLLARGLLRLDDARAPS